MSPVPGKWVVEVWAMGVEGAAKVTVMYDEEPGIGLISKLKSSASGAYRVAYQEWPMPWNGLQVHGHKITPPPEAPAPASPPQPEAESPGA